MAKKKLSGNTNTVNCGKLSPNNVMTNDAGNSPSEASANTRTNCWLIKIVNSTKSTANNQRFYKYLNPTSLLWYALLKVLVFFLQCSKTRQKSKEVNSKVNFDGTKN